MGSSIVLAEREVISEVHLVLPAMLPSDHSAKSVSRILVYGVTGSGKTTLASRISKVLDIPFHSADDLAFEPGWVTVSTELQKERVDQICASEEWILDSAYSKWIEGPLSRVELIVALDYPRWLSLGRLMRRTWHRVVSKETCCNGNVETLKLVFSRDSILLWHFKSFKSKRARINNWVSEGRTVMVFRSQKEVEKWLHKLQEQSDTRS